MPRKERARLYDVPSHGRTRPDTNGSAAGDAEDTRGDTVPAGLSFAEKPSPSRPYDALVSRELPLYPGVPQTFSRYDEPTVPDAPLGRGSPTAMLAAGQASSTTEHTAAPPSGTRNCGSAPELPPAPESPPVPEPSASARARELKRMMRLVTPLPTNEWTVVPSVHEWRAEWGGRRDSSRTARERRRSRLRLRTLVLVVATLLAAAVIGTALGDARKITRVIDRVTELVRGTKTSPATLPLPVAPPSAVATSIFPPPDEPSRATAALPPPAEVPVIPTVRIGDLPLLATPAEETAEADGASPKKPAAKGPTTRKSRPAKAARRR